MARIHPIMGWRMRNRWDPRRKRAYSTLKAGKSKPVIISDALDIPRGVCYNAEIYPKPQYAFDGLPFQGGLDPFIRDNMRGEVIPAWKHVFHSGPYAGTTDPALITNPMSRLANFYVEGLDYMCRRWGIDGIYIDDVGYDGLLG